MQNHTELKSMYSKFGLRKMVLNNTCKMPDRMASLLITADAPAFKQAYFEPILLYNCLIDLKNH
ncbi:hypothetical protein DC083_04340 [Ignatzschineria ureiclastica]|uniref:Uncharacterized protein n=1 Tax=Ignatzschineria ureiclastica TaxID=472582 RepID=A0A2U2AEQ3_9GAMM|nr:hypothetical protein DC083_04340 [Ignatzschineria ureiclastica]GGZ96499.1 hypothetical protein GCM10007162_10730 [Ignatzschineria ureiclastica]